MADARGERLIARALASLRRRAFEVEQITTCIRMGGTIAWVPIRTIYAGAPSHIRPLAHLREWGKL